MSLGSTGLGSSLESELAAEARILIPDGAIGASLCGFSK